MSATADPSPAVKRSAPSRAAADVTTEVATDVHTTVERRPRARSVVLVLVVLLLVAAALLGGVLLRRGELATANGVLREAGVPEVRVLVAAARTTAQQVTLPASTAPLQRTVIRARASGYVRRWLVDLGARVEAGQVLAEIETPDLDQDVRSTEAQLEQAKASLELARINAERFRQLSQVNAVAQQELDDREALLRAREAEVRAAEASLTRVRELTQFQRVAAPFAGVITARHVEIGDLVSPTGDAGGLFVLEQSDTLRVFVDVPQSQMRAITVGLKAELRLREFPGRAFPAEVVRTAGALDATTRTLRVELRVPNDDGALLAGAFAQVRFSLPSPEAVFAVPVASVMIRAQGPQVAVIAADDTVKLQNVTLGRDLGTELEITSGLTPGDRVVLNPTDLLRPGTKVRVAGN